MVPIPFDNPIRILAYLGAISRWLTLYPEMANPLQATPSVSAVMAPVFKKEKPNKIQIIVHCPIRVVSPV